MSKKPCKWAFNPPAECFPWNVICISHTFIPKMFPNKAWGSLTEVQDEGILHVFDLPQLELVSLVVGFVSCWLGPCWLGPWSWMLNGKFMSLGWHACLVWKFIIKNWNKAVLMLFGYIQWMGPCCPTLGPHLDQVPKGPHCWVKLGPTLGTQKYFGFQMLTFCWCVL